MCVKMKTAHPIVFLKKLLFYVYVCVENSPCNLFFKKLVHNEYLDYVPCLGCQILDAKDIAS